ncbi:Hypothetical protein D9617_38g090900 [Elsinoe fawcettii]|nr:Hypothetical protein D9617_38g090900 [Elsinoe fawcettii]
MPPSANTNDAGIEKRLAIVQDIFRETFSSNPKAIQPLAYEEDFPFPYNNFVYLVSRETTGSSGTKRSELPGTQSIPEDQHDFIVRLPNPLSGYNDTVRVENEGASLQLAREALSPGLPGLVPCVYGWSSAKDGQQGWILQEYKKGHGLLDNFDSMDNEKQAIILGHMADILKVLQNFGLPSSVTKYGGLTFDSNGDIVSAPMSIQQGGPYESYHDLVLGTIRSKLQKADQDPIVDGWKGHGIRNRIDHFLESRFDTIMSSVTQTKKTLVHADFCTVADEFFRSLGHGIGRFPDPRDGPETLPLHDAMLHGFPDPLPQPSDDIRWSAARTWDDALQTRDMWRPRNIPGMTELSELFWLSSQILPFKLVNEVVVGNSSEDQLLARKKEGEVLLDHFLRKHGC